ncbi:MAG: hypothetical protein COU47_04045 [Candidatus Niyogibacteria bacterium CG10_big_fil_rev_8_21_14_0_10_46_36]|uniref:ComEC/Rec2-related protein domain-containing protein n=1 Tax=Candidatus Niyogibacteria bacterium CG10_big_fil_rev_8_21_14_0_10_46_36 TaxID=1974726 RepID=A0A2H0TCG5_9BACT|nr:MAG: hypothetical protein COU47_04045 [Candidatus Niyogibacteria bacterium CG10_big_fil_rev_8_21_14_0_10_46_36]
MRERALVISIIGFGAGISIRSFFTIAEVYAVFGLFLAAGFFIFWRVRGAGLFFIIALLFAGGSFGVLRFNMKDRGGVNPEWARVVGNTVLLRGIITSEADERDRYTRFVVASGELFDWNEKAWRSVPSEKILFTVSRYPSFVYGDIVEARGRLEPPENIPDSDFDWESYLAKDEIYLQMSYPSTALIGRGGFFLKRWLFSLKEEYIQRIGSVLPEPHASFLGGLTVGARKSIPENVLEEFRRVGVIHIVVLSGYNITIVARAFAGFLGVFFSWAVSVGAGVAGIILFALFTGAAAPVVRASIMAILIYTAQATGRINRVIIALLIAGALMIFVNPKILLFDASFQLSFLATLGLIYLAPRFERMLSWAPKRFGLREAATATLSAQIAVTPLILHLMGTFSVVALPVNMLVLVVVPYTMFFGATAGALAFASKILALPFAWVAYILLEYQLKIVETFSSLSFAEIALPGFPLIAMLVLYIGIAWLIIRRK